MEAENLKTASTYVNNLLLARGLLRDGNPIDFTRASASDGSKGGVLARVINLVHDLVLRRDRETDSLTELSSTLTQLRASTSEHTQRIARLEARNAELERQATQSASQEQSAKASLKTAEARNRTLREEVARVKSGASQVRTQCSHDVRKRDAEIRRLQKYLEARRREGGASQIHTTVITPGITKASSGSQPGSHAASASSQSYSLREETTSFLTQLSQSLSDENDGLISLVQGTVATLRSLQGLPDPEPEAADAGICVTAPPSREVLAEQTEGVLEALRALLTNPSFVPLEEVAVRDEEIARLRAGFERIEGRWTEAMGLMDGWRRRMLASGGAVDLDDLRRGLQLGSARSSSATGVDGVSLRASQRSAESDDDLRVEAELANVESPMQRPDPLYPILAQTQDRRPAPAAEPAAERALRAPPLRPTAANARSVNIHANSAAVGALVAALSDDEDDVALLDAEMLREDVENADPLSVAQKLELARSEADAEQRRRDEDRARRAERERTRTERDADARTGSKRKGDDADDEKPLKRTAIPRRTGRGKRRSTLSPEELQGLMGM